MTARTRTRPSTVTPEVASEPPAAAVPPSSPRAPRRRKPAAPVEMADKSAPITATRLEHYEVQAATEAAQASREMALSDVMARRQRGEIDDATWRDQLQALIAGSSPDDLALMRGSMAARRQPVPMPGVDPDTELAPGWRDGAYPYRHLMARRNYEQQKYRLQVE
nr:hypothetical protein [Sphaerotilus sp.]